MKSSVPRILVVDDDPGFREVLRLLLRQSGRFEVAAEAGDGDEALVVAREEQPHVALIDLVLTAERSTELLASLAAHAPETMVAVLTGVAAEDEEASARAAGAFVYYEKRSLGALPEHLEHDLALFHRALAGADVVAPSAVDRRDALPAAPAPERELAAGRDAGTRASEADEETAE